jgi:hypothetical protein
MTPTRYPNGVNNTPKNAPLGSYILPNPMSVHQYFNDFDTYVAGDWTITEVGTGSRALTDADGGVLLVTNGSTDDNSNFFNKVGESFLMESGKKAYFEARFKVSDATQSDFVIGLQITDTTPLDVTDGIFFRKDDADANLDFVVEKDNTATTASAVTTVSDDTYLTVSFVYNGSDEVEYYVNGSKLGTSVTTNLPDDEELTVSFGIQNGEGVAKTMSLDYIFAAKER